MAVKRAIALTSYFALVADSLVFYFLSLYLNINQSPILRVPLRLPLRTFAFKFHLCNPATIRNNLIRLNRLLFERLPPTRSVSERRRQVRQELDSLHSQDFNYREQTLISHQFSAYLCAYFCVPLRLNFIYATLQQSGIILLD